MKNKLLVLYLTLKLVCKYHRSFAIFSFACFLISCQWENILSDVYTCKKIEKYPFLFSYKTDSLRAALESKAAISLVSSQIERYFTKDAFDNTDRTTELLYGGKYEIFPVNKIIYSKSAIAIYLVKEIERRSFPDGDIISLVMYDNSGKPVDIINVDLLNSFGSKEVNFISPSEFEVLWIDDEYSPDPESEPEDIKKGKENVPVLITTVYKIDTVGLKFIRKDSWQEDMPLKEEVIAPSEMCFESVSPNAFKATPLYEYLKISWLNDSIWGSGTGDFMAGSEPWALSFSGKFEGNNMKLNVKYRQEGKDTLITTEVWTLDLKNKRLHRKDHVASHNSMGAAEYAKIKCDEIPEYYKNINPK